MSKKHADKEDSLVEERGGAPFILRTFLFLAVEEQRRWTAPADAVCAQHTLCCTRVYEIHVVPCRSP